jgi:HPt (histidine-containing phosphotransfer) domain-containing protein
MNAILLPFEGGLPAVRAVQPPELKEICELDLLIDRCMGDEGLAADLLRRFADRLTTTIGEIERSIAHAQWAEGLACVHSLKGEAGSLAAVQVQQAAIEFEKCARSERKDDIARWTEALRKASEQFRQTLPRLLVFLADTGTK